MYAFLAKKIAIPNGQLSSIDWSKSGHLAIGGQDGLLRVLLFDSTESGPKLTMNQPLEAHESTLTALHWNQERCALTAADENGLIDVWTQSGTEFRESMVSQRDTKDGHVGIAGMQWTGDGEKIIIAYEDGQVVMGTAEGSRTLSAQTGMGLRHVAMTPNAKHVVLVNKDNELKVVDALIKPVKTLSTPGVTADDGDIVAIRWTVPTQHGAPSLAVVWQSGRVQLQRGLDDTDPVVVSAGLGLVTAEWNPTGEILALLAVPADSESGRRHASVLFMDGSTGKHVQTLRVSITRPMDAARDITWSADSQQLAMAVGNYVYFASVRRSYEHGFMDTGGRGTFVYSFRRPDRKEDMLAFWRLDSTECIVKGIAALQLLRCSGDHTLAVCSLDDDGESAVVLFNPLGAPIDTLKLGFPPDFFEVSHTVCVLGTTSGELLLWKYRDAADAETSAKPVIATDAIIHHWVGSGVGSAVQTINALTPPAPADPTTAIAVTDSMLVTASQSGACIIFSISPNGVPAILGRATVDSPPVRLHLNPTCTRLAAIDANSVLTVYTVDLQADPMLAPALTADGDRYRRTEVWDFVWATDAPEMFATCEKGKLVVTQGTTPEDPQDSPVHLCSLNRMLVRGVDLDGVRATPDSPPRSAAIEFEVKSLRDARQVMLTASVDDARDFVAAHPHPVLWGLLADMALRRLDFNGANVAYTRAKDYHGLQFVRRLRAIADEPIQHAEVAAHLGQFDEAEAMLLAHNRPDLALGLRRRLGDWIRLRALLKTSQTVDDTLARAADGHIGRYYEERGEWGRAVKHYQAADDWERVALMHARLEDYPAAANLIDRLDPASSTLDELGNVLLSVGMADDACRAFLRQGRRDGAVDACITMNRWFKAIEIAGVHPALVKKVRGPLVEYSRLLCAEGRDMAAALLLSQCGYHDESARLLGDFGARVLAADVTKKAGVDAPPAMPHLVLLKRVWLMAALEQTAAKSGKLTKGKLGLQAAVDDGWAPAKAAHFLLLAQTHLTRGKFGPAAVAGRRAALYGDVTSGLLVGSTVALACLLAGDMAGASDHMTTLESADAATPGLRARYVRLALRLFREGVGAAEEPWVCSQCKAAHIAPHINCPGCGASVDACMATGRVIQAGDRVDVCGRCRQPTLQGQAAMRDGQAVCGMCHAPFVRLSDV